MNWRKIATMLQSGKEVDVSDITVREFIMLEQNLKASGILFSKKYDKRNMRMYVCNYSDLTDLINKNRK